MHQSLPNHKSVSRFRRWSRKSFSVFASLGREVSIGMLTVAMTARIIFSELLQETLVQLFDRQEEDELTDAEFLSHELELQTIVISTRETSAPAVVPLIL